MTQMTAAATPVLELRDVSKSFGPVVALRSGTPARPRPARSTPSSGRTAPASRRWSRSSPACTAATAASFLLGGEPVDFGSTAESKAAGIAVIYQEPTLFPDLSVTENIFMGRQLVGRRPPHRPCRDVRRGRGASSTGSACDIDPRRPARGLSIADQQIIEIAKAISLDARLLIMDEPTAALSGVEVERLFAVARSLRDEGRALVFISHRFDEVFALCDTVTVMRDGAYIATVPHRRDHRRRRSSRRWSAARSPTSSPRPPPRSASRSSRSRASAPPASSTTSPSPCAPARSSAWPASSAPAAARSPARSSASTATTPARVTARRQAPSRGAARAPRSDAGHGLRPRGPPQAGPGHRGLGRPQRRRA